MINVFVGYDPRQPVAFQVLAHSIISRCSKPVAVTPLLLKQLPIKRRGLTDFTFSRFLVPYLCNYDDIGIFIDSDFLCLGDLAELDNHVALYSGDNTAVYVVQHENHRFEWPSLMAFINERCRVLTPEFVDDCENRLYNFDWTEKVGSLPKEWNHLVGYDTPRTDAKLIHYTQGIPCWPETKDCEYSKEWWDEFNKQKSTVSFDALMGKSVHAKHVYARLNK